MHIKLPFLIFLLAHAAQCEANLFARSSETIVGAVTRAHRHATRRSAGLARDLRLSFRGILAEQKPANPRSAKVYCVSTSSGLTSNNGTRPSNGTSGAPSIGFNPVSSSSSGPSASSNSTSATATGAGGTSTTTSSGSTPSANPGNGTTNAGNSSPWKLAQSYQGNSFFNGWDFFTDADPTHGVVDYIDQSDAQAAGLIDINNAGHAIMRVETTPQVPNVRKSIRITTQFTYTGGLVLMDAVHMPTGCGTWPAFWSNGPNWPAGGEIDIVEGVNDYTVNQATIHTNPGCTMPTSNSGSLNISGAVISVTNCAAAQTGNAGCGVRDARTNSYGSGFNSNGGGVYAMKWDNSGISVFFFPRNSIPSDITAGSPLPDTWGQPMAFYPASTCNPFQFFSQHSAIFDTTLCGDWASGVWGATGTPGQEQSCAQRTGVATCEQFVAQNGANFAQAYWEVGYVKIFKTS